MPDARSAAARQLKPPSITATTRYCRSFENARAYWLPFPGSIGSQKMTLAGVPSGFSRYGKRSGPDLVPPRSRFRLPVPLRLITTVTLRAPAISLASAHRYRHCKTSSSASDLFPSQRRRLPIRTPQAAQGHRRCEARGRFGDRTMRPLCSDRSGTAKPDRPDSYGMRALGAPAGPAGFARGRFSPVEVPPCGGWGPLRGWSCGWPI